MDDLTDDLTMVELSGHFHIKLSIKEIREAGGDFQQAAQNAMGHTGAMVSEVADYDDNIRLEDG